MDTPTHVIVLANETVAGPELQSLLAKMAKADDVHIHVVVPALSSRFEHIFSDVDGPRERAQKRLDQSLAALAAVGVKATGSIGDDNPEQAFEDATAEYFEPDAVVVSTHPPGRSNWLERGIVERVKGHTEAPVTQIVVDLAAARAEASLIQGAVAG